MFSFLGSGKNRDLAAEEELVRGITPSSTPTSLELWTVSKILGRECATVNKDFFVCKRDMGDKPSHCAAQADLVMNCTHNMYYTLYPSSHCSLLLLKLLSIIFLLSLSTLCN